MITKKKLLEAWEKAKEKAYRHSRFIDIGALIHELPDDEPNISEQNNIWRFA